MRTVLLLLLAILIQHETDGQWLFPSRRRRQPPPCRPKNCQVDQWSHWTRCSTPCGNSGTQVRIRSKVILESCGGSCPYHLSERRACNRNACQNGGTPAATYCKCKTGFTGTCCEIVISTTPPTTVSTTVATTTPTTAATSSLATPSTKEPTTASTALATTAATTKPETPPTEEPTTASTTAATTEATTTPEIPPTEEPTTASTTAATTAATTTPETPPTEEPTTASTTAATTAATTTPTTTSTTEVTTSPATASTEEPTTAATGGTTTEAQTTTASTVTPTSESASVSPSCDGGYLPHTKCCRDYVKVGAFKENSKDRATPVLLLTDRDCSSEQNDGHLLDCLACRCAEKAKQRNWKVFGLQNYGECWSGPGAEHTFAKYGTAGPHNAVQILTNTSTMCDMKNPQECIGKDEINYVYRLQ